MASKASKELVDQMDCLKYSIKEIKRKLVDYIGEARVWLPMDGNGLDKVWIHGDHSPQFRRIQDSTPSLGGREQENVHDIIARKYGSFLIQFLQAALRRLGRLSLSTDEESLYALDCALLSLDILIHVRDCLKSSEYAIESLMFKVAKICLDRSSKENGLRLLGMIQRHMWTYHSKLVRKRKPMVDHQPRNDANVSWKSVACDFPEPETLHQNAFAKIVLNVLQLCMTHWSEEQDYDTLLEIAQNIALPWALRTTSSSVDVMFRVLWNSASRVEKRKSVAQGLKFRLIALRFAFLCPQHDTGYIIQQTFRVGVHACKKGDQERHVVTFYSQVYHLIQLPSINSIVCDEMFDWMVHFTTICLKTNTFSLAVSLLERAMALLQHGKMSPSVIAIWKVLFTALSVEIQSQWLNGTGFQKSIAQFQCACNAVTDFDVIDGQEFESLLIRTSSHSSRCARIVHESCDQISDSTAVLKAIHSCLLHLLNQFESKPEQILGDICQLHRISISFLFQERNFSRVQSALDEFCLFIQAHPNDSNTSVLLSTIREALSHSSKLLKSKQPSPAIEILQATVCAVEIWMRLKQNESDFQAMNLKSQREPAYRLLAAAYQCTRNYDGAMNASFRCLLATSQLSTDVPLKLIASFTSNFVHLAMENSLAIDCSALCDSIVERFDLEADLIPISQRVMILDAIYDELNRWGDQLIDDRSKLPKSCKVYDGLKLCHEFQRLILELSDFADEIVIKQVLVSRRESLAAVYFCKEMNVASRLIQGLEILKRIDESNALCYCLASTWRAILQLELSFALAYDENESDLSYEEVSDLFETVVRLWESTNLNPSTIRSSLLKLSIDTLQSALFAAEYLEQTELQVKLKSILKILDRQKPEPRRNDQILSLLSQVSREIQSIESKIDAGEISQGLVKIQAILPVCHATLLRYAHQTQSKVDSTRFPWSVLRKVQAKASNSLSIQARTTECSALLCATVRCLSMLCRILQYLGQPSRCLAYCVEAVSLLDHFKRSVQRRRSVSLFVDILCTLGLWSDAQDVFQSLCPFTPRTRIVQIQMALESLQRGDLLKHLNEKNGALAAYNSAQQMLISLSDRSPLFVRALISIGAISQDEKLVTSITQALKSDWTLIEKAQLILVLAQCPSFSRGEARKALESTLEKMYHVPCFHLQRELCRSLSYLLAQDQEYENAVYLQHLSINITYRFDSKDDSLEKKMEELKLDLYSQLHQIHTSLPHEWIIVSITSTSSGDIVMTRLEKNYPPIFARNTVPSWQSCVATFEMIIEDSRLVLSDHHLMQESCMTDCRSTLNRDGSDEMSAQAKREWWKTRRDLNDQLKDCVEEMSDRLGFWKCLFTPARSCPRIDQVISQYGNGLDRNKRQILRLLLLDHNRLTAKEIRDGLCYCLDTSDVMNLLDQMMQTSEMEDLSREEIDKMKVVELKTELKQRGLSTSGLKQQLKERLIEYITSQPPVVMLVLGETIQQFPWEGIGPLRHAAVTRLPRMDLLYPYLCSGKENRIQAQQVRYVINPAGDLKSTEAAFEPLIERFRLDYGWEGIQGSSPSPQEMKEYLRSADLFIYCGHGSGEKYLSRKQVATVDRCSSGFLIGCSSGRLDQHGIYDPTGMVWSYLQQHAPSVLALLWDVTDKDIDRQSLFLINQSFDQDESTSTIVNHKLESSRLECKLEYLTGLATVFYGLPMEITRDKRD